MQIECSPKPDNLSTTITSPHTPRIISTPKTSSRKDFNIKPRASRPKHFLAQLSPHATVPTESKQQDFVEQLEITRKTQPNISDIQIPPPELLSPTKKSAFYSQRSRPASPYIELAESDIVGDIKSLGPKSSSKALENILGSGQKKQGEKLVMTRGVSRDGSLIVSPRTHSSMSQRMNITHSSSFKLSAIPPKKETSIIPPGSQLKMLKIHSEEHPFELDTLGFTPKSQSSKPFSRGNEDCAVKKGENVGDLGAKFRKELKKADSLKNVKSGRAIYTSDSARGDRRKFSQAASEFGSPRDDLNTENTPRIRVEDPGLELKRMGKSESRPMESPIDDVSNKMREFLLKSQGTCRSLRGVSCDAKFQKELSATERNKYYDIWDDMGSAREEEYVRPKKGALEQVFVTGPNDFFQINPTNKTYREFIEFFNEDLRNAEGHEKYDRRMFEEKRITKEDYKPMMIWFGEGSKIVQPKYMTSMGSMCYTELWPKKMNQRMQKQLVRGGDYVRMGNGAGRIFETVYRPKKWLKDNDFKKKMDGNTQAIKNGHEAEKRTALPFGPGRNSRMIIQDNKKC